MDIDTLYFWERWAYPWWLVVFLFVVALLIARWTSGSFRTRISAFGMLAIAFVLYVGFVWEIWWWVRLIFWIALIVGIICAIVAYFDSEWRGYTWWAVVARRCAYVALAIAVTLFLWEGLVQPFAEWAKHQHWWYGTGDNSSSITHDKSTGPAEPVQSGSTSASPGTASTCPEGSWTMVGGKPVANGVWFKTKSIHSAHTSQQAINAFYDWYKQAVNRTELVKQLAGALYTTYPADLADHGCASESMIAFGKRLNTTLNHSVYYPEGSSIRVVAPGAVEFRVMADTGQLRELH
jgi:hypothetical protein